jgi:hypothetical protein
LSWTISGCETTSAGRYSTANARLACTSTAAFVDGFVAELRL